MVVILMMQKKKKTDWQRLKENPVAMARYKEWRQQYLRKKKRQNKHLQNHIYSNIDESKPQLDRFDNPVRQGGRLSDIERRLERVEKELGIDG